MMAQTEKVEENTVDEEKISKECGTYFTHSCNKGTQKDVVAKKGSARTYLHELCFKQHWKRPIFQCCNEEGPDHQKLFTFKVIVDVAEKLTTLECYGNPRANKKAAAENAAEGAVWCLKHMGYQLTK